MRLHQLLLLLALPLAAHAQVPSPPAPTQRFYVGAALYTSYYQSPGVGVGVPGQLTLGYQLRPRWAVQLSATYSSYRSNYFLPSSYRDASGTEYPFTQQGTATDRRLALALLGRYTLTRRPTQRVQVYALGGFVYECGQYTSTGTTTFNGPNPFPNNPATSEFNTNARNLLLGIGPGVSCRLVGLLDAQFEMVLGGYLSTTLLNPPGTAVGSASLGLRYRFGGE